MNTMTDNSLQYAALVQQRLTLEVLDRFGPVTTDRIPRAWPLDAGQLAGILRDLAGAGAVSFHWDPICPGRRQVRLTPEGARLLKTAPNGEPLRAA